jgi:drug/metabolite transporter (DMT)-like permease
MLYTGRDDVNRLTSPTTTVIETTPQTQGGMLRSFLLVFACTIIGALAQLFLKQGTAQLGARATHVSLLQVVKDPTLIWAYCMGILTNFKLFCGYCMYGIVTFLMALALKGRELSRLFPIIALTYVWVTILSLFVLGEHMNFFRSAGIAFIVGGVSVLGLKK